MKANKFIVTDINTVGNLRQIEESIHSHEGINAVRIDSNAGTITVDYDEGKYSEGDIKKFVSQTGVDVKQIM